MTVLDRDILCDLTGDAAFLVGEAAFLVGDFLAGDFLAGETLFIGESLLLLAGERDANVFALLIDLGLITTGWAVIDGETPNPKVVDLTGDFALFGSGLETRAENIGRAPLILSGDTLTSAAAAFFPLWLLRSRPRRSSTLAGALGAGTGFSFLTVDFDLDALLTGEGFGAVFVGDLAFLTLFERDFLSVFLISFLA